MLSAEYDSFCDAPVGRYTVVGTIIVWCDSSSLCGALLWGAPGEDETRKVLHIFDQYDRHMERAFDIVLDTRGVDHVERAGLGILFSWLMARRDLLAPRIRLQASIINEGPIGFLLTGLLPVVGRTHPYKVFTDPSAAWRAVGARESIGAELDAIAAALGETPEDLRRLRSLLARDPSLSIERAARELETSPRSLQRSLSASSTSFSDEVTEARLARAMDLLRTTDEKLVAISARVGISERSLTVLFRGKTGLTPAAWRARERERGAK
ncbi:MAG: helix-turn-helix domain-containing protein [Myxococcales bacterium]|nr:helix-turn-helix domain-containing protein [Myxococcales bacterium]